MDGIEKEAVRAACVGLKGGWRIATKIERVSSHRGADHFGLADEAVGSGPGIAPALVPCAQGAGQIGIGGNEVARRSGIRSAGGGQPLENREIMLRIVDRVPWIGRPRPTQAGSGRGFGPPCKLGKIGQPSFGRAQGFERIEGRNTRARLGLKVKARVGKADPAFGRSDHKRQHQALVLKPALVGREAAADLLSTGIKQDRLLDDLARKHPLGQPRNKHRVEAQPAGRLGRADENLAVAVQRRRDRSFQEQGPEDIHHFAKRNRPNRRDRRQLGKDREYPVGTFERPGGEVAQPPEPVTPIGGRGPAVEEVNHGQGVRGERGQIVESARHDSGLGLVLIGQLGELCPQLVCQTVEASPPAIA